MSSYRRIFSKQYQRLLYPGGELRFDIINPLSILLLCGIGVLFIYSAQYSHPGGGDWKKQIFWIVIGLGTYSVISAINYKIFLEYAHIIYLAGIAGLLLTNELSPISVEMMGARRWIDLGVTVVQPTEAAKIGTLIMAASILARSEIGTVRDSLWTLAKLAFVFLLPMLLIFLQPDLGSSLVFPPMVFALLYVSRLSEKFFLSAFAIFAVALAVLGADIYGYSQHLEKQQAAKLSGVSITEEYHSPLPIHNYQRNRILTFVAPKVVDPNGTGASWNAIQATISAATGGLTGKGLFKGTQAQLGYLPQAVAHNDFIFSVIAEETGFLGSAFVVGLFCLIVANGIRIAGLARDRFGMQLAVGVSILFLVHFFINIGMTIGITPITGLPLPFLSYGGSFVLSCFILQGLVQSVYRYRKDFT